MLYLLSGLVFLFPLFFLPVVVDAIGTGKVLYLVFICFLILLVFGIKSLRSGKLKFNFVKLDFLVLLFFLANLISFCFLGVGAKVRSVFQPLGMGTVTGLTFFYFFIAQLNHPKKKPVFDTAFSVSLSVLSIAAAVLFLLPAHFFPILNVINNANWSTAGSGLILAQVILPFLVLNLSLLIKKAAEKDKKAVLAPFLLSLILAIGLAVSVFQTYKTKAVALDGATSWAVAVETFKKQPFFGVGPGNYFEAFDRFRPAEFNKNEFWQTRFSAPKSLFLLVWTEAGIFGLLALILIFWESLKLGLKQKIKKGLLLVWLMVLFFSPHIVTVFSLFLILAHLRERGKEKEFSLILKEKNSDIGLPLMAVISLIAAAFFGLVLFFGARSEFYFFRATVAASENKGGDAYKWYLKTVNSNRFLTKGRIAFSQVNLSLAENLFTKKEANDEEKKQAATLLGQAVAEAKAAAALEPKNSVVWENLAQIYRRMIGSAAGAEGWAESAYQQAVSLSPFDPRLRVDFGGLLYGLGKFEEAGKQFETAVRLNPNFANAWYNWAWAEKQQKRLSSGVEKLQQAVNLVTPDTTDFEKASKELNEWTKELGEAAAEKPKKETEELKTPELLPSSKIEEKTETEEKGT